MTKPNSNNLLAIWNMHSQISVEVCADRSLDLNEIQKLSPAFCSVVWRTQSDVALRDVSKILAVFLSKQLSLCGNRVVLHLAGRQLNKPQVTDILNELQRINVRHVFVLQGEPSPEYKDKSDFCYANDLIKFIKSRYGNYFCIGVAGYPDLSLNKADNLKYLKWKVDAGADFIITQIFYNSEMFSDFYKECRKVGINVPIIPGIHVINSYNSLMSMMRFCKVEVPPNVMTAVQKNKQNSEAVCNYGIFHCSQLIRELFLDKDMFVRNVHFFSLNNIKLIRKICKILGLCEIRIERPIMLNVDKKNNCSIPTL